MSAPRVALIVALARGGVIGRDNALPWHLRGDLQRFKRLTMDHPIVMGRRTFDSIGRALPGRENRVLSRSGGLRLPGCRVYDALAPALESPDTRGVFVIGGAQIYAAALPFATHLYVTAVDAHVQGDTVFPAVDWSGWSLVGYEARRADAHNDFDYTFYDFVRRP